MPFFLLPWTIPYIFTVAWVNQFKKPAIWI